MKKLLIVLLIALSKNLYAQNITAIEYWVDNDPGFSKATPVTSITPAKDISSFKLSFVGALSKGVHIIGIRSKDEYGVWSHTSHVYVDVLDSSKGKTVEIEYFWDNDPGFSNGQKQKLDIPIKDLSEAILKASVPNTLSQGDHSLYVRSIDDRGRWSHTNYAGQVTLLPLINDTVFTDTTVCSKLITPDGKTFKKTGTYIGAQQKGNRYQIIKYNLVVKPVEVGVTRNNGTLIVKAVDAKYQWVDCNNNYQPIIGETQTYFTAKSIGSYAVVVTENGCTDTSNCFAVNTVSIKSVSRNQSFELYPNPNSGTFIIEFSNSFEGSKTLVVTDILGKQMTKYMISSKTTSVHLNVEKGLYFLNLINNKNRVIFTEKIIIQ